MAALARAPLECAPLQRAEAARAIVICIKQDRRPSGTALTIRLLLAVGALGAQVAPCAAQDTQASHSGQPGPGFYIAPMVQAVRTDSDRAVDDDPTFTLAAGYALHPNWNIELNLFRGRFDGEQGNDLTMNALGVNALRVFRREAVLSPYLLVGLGAQEKDRTLDGSSTNAYADAGAGLLTTFRRSKDDGRALSLRLDARARYDDADGGSRIDYFLGLGLQYAFGSRASTPSMMQAAPAAPADEDHDGIVDSNDRCPGTPAGRAVGADGCEPDSDFDGVVDSVDACPGTPHGTRVDARGCAIKEEIRLPVVRFDYDSAHLSPATVASLAEAVQILRKNPDVSVEVAGHTDSRGPDAYNLALAQRRAEAVRGYLVDNGVTNRLAVHSYGESKPSADNSTAAGRAQNRRVVLLIVE